DVKGGGRPSGHRIFHALTGRQSKENNMTQVRSRSLTALFTMLLLVSLPMLGIAADKPVARMATSISSVEWQVSTPSDRVTLSVTGPDGFLFSKTFPAGTNPSLRLQDITSDDLNGSYSYELRFLPRISKDVREQLNKAREMGDDQEIARIQKAAGITAAAVQSGAFMIMNGSFVSPDQQEPRGGVAASSTATTASATAGNPHGTPIQAKDQVIADDLIVQGSICGGLDCVNGESFGFDTLRLKENNVRIAFVDTSSSAGFPSTDRTLEANDTTTGGANRFSIVDNTDSTTPFTVTGAAPTNSIFVAANGKVG